MNLYLRRFFEQLLPLGYWPKNTDSWIEGLADNFTFLNQELFLYCIASLLKNECFDVVNDLLARDYYFPPTSTEVQDRMVAYSEFNRSCVHVDRYFKLQEQRKLSSLGELIKVRANRTDLRFEDLMQADFILFLRGIIHEADWWPYTLVYTIRMMNYPFELFARSQSLAYFTRAKQSLGVSDIDDLRNLIQRKKNTMQVPAWQGRPINPSVLANVKLLCTQP